MRRKTKGLLIFWSGVILLAFGIKFCDDKRYDDIAKEFNQKSFIPAPDPSRGKALFYSVQDGDWIYQGKTRAKASNRNIEPYYNSEKEFDEMLKKKIPEYRKKTFWGDEFDRPDPIWDDEGDDHILDPDYRKK